MRYHFFPETLEWRFKKDSQTRKVTSESQTAKSYHENDENPFQNIVYFSSMFD